jgi:hypothetical protein
MRSVLFILEVMARAAFAVMVAAWLAVFASAQAMPGAGSPAVGPGDTISAVPDSHAWVVLPGDSLYPWRVVHVPPRAQARAGDGKRHGAADGVLRSSARLTSRPAAAAGVGNTLYLLFETPGALEAGVRRQVYSLSVRSAGVSDLWRDDPLDRLVVSPSLPAVDPYVQVAGMAGTPAGPVVLLAASRDAPAGTRGKLLLLGPEGWESIALPGVPPGTAIRAVGDRRGLAVVTLAAGEPSLWRAGVPARAEGGYVAPEWVREELRLPAEAEGDPALEGWVVLRCGEVTVGAKRDDGGVLRLWSLEKSGGLIGEVAGVPSRYAIVPQDGLGRVAVVWPGGGGAVPDARTATVPVLVPPEIREVSVWTGRVLYAGAAKGAGPITANDTRLLTLGMLMLTTVVLLFVLRADDPPELTLPEGFALAEPGRRCLASLIDGAIAASVAARFWGLSLSDLLSVETLLSQNFILLAAAILGVGMGIGTLTEWLFGRTVGKFLTGCAVLGVPSGPWPRLGSSEGGAEGHPSPSFARSLVRNAVKWLLPPLAALAMLDPVGRHRGDIAARAVVVIALAPEE